jgi:DNA-binding CsgD family transcriptional regulator/tetratricopeptide (TPR) repeat protein
VVGRTTSRTLIGRDRERALLDAAFATARAGTPVTVLVTGEAGIGKTRLVREFLSRADMDSVVLTGGCVDEHVPYLPITDCLRSLQRTGWQPDRRAAADLAAVLPELRTSTDPSPRDRDSAGRLQRTFLRTLESLGCERPVVLAIEDLHWSDTSTRNLLSYVIRAARDIPLLVVGTYRTDELTRRHPVRPFLAEITRLPLTEVVELERLDRDGVTQMLTEILGMAPSTATAGEVHERCSGNPFLAEEIAASVGSGSAGRIPPLLQDVLLARTSSLSVEASEVLRVAAVGGVHVDERLLRTVLVWPSPELEAALRELLDHHLLEPDVDGTGYVFRHALTAEAVYEESLPGERSRLHASFAHALEQDPSLAHVGPALAALERARHWHHARNIVEALPAWIEAAAAAERVHAQPEALGAYESALQLWPSVEGANDLAGMDEVELLRRAAQAANLAGAPPRALVLSQHALSLVDERADVLRAAVLLERLGRYAYLSGREAEALTYYERGVALAPEQPPTPERARVLAGQATILNVLRLPGAAERAREAIDVARQVGATAVEADALTTLADAEASLGYEAAALTGFEDAARLTEVEGDIENTSRLWVNRIYALFGLGLIEEAAAVPPEAQAAMREVGQERSAIWIGNRALPLLDLGRWDEARLLLDANVAIESLDPGRDNILQARVWLHWLTGDLPGAEQDLAMLDLTRSQDAYQAQGVACVAIETRHWETAVAATAEAVRSLPRESGHPMPHWEALTAMWLGLWAAAEISAERGEAGASWLAPFLVAFDELLAATALRPADRRPVRYRALLALCGAERSRVDGAMSSADWRHAVVETDALGAVAQRSYSRVRYAEALLGEGGDRAGATTSLNEAVALFADVPRAPIRLLAQQVGRRARIRLTVEDEALPPASEKHFGLTPRELDVLSLMAEARTDREIGETLFISRKTAGVHVSSVMRKLGVNRRADAARLAKRVLGEDDPPNS